MIATLLDPMATEFKCTHLEMMKGINGHGYYDTLTVPIIENTARECELTDRMRFAMLKYPRSNAVLVRRHGVYVWGQTWIEAKTQAECYDYLFQAAAQMVNLHLDPGRVPAAVVTNGQMPTAATEAGRTNDEGVSSIPMLWDQSACSICPPQQVAQHLNVIAGSSSRGVDGCSWIANPDGLHEGIMPEPEAELPFVWHYVKNRFLNF